MVKAIYPLPMEGGCPKGRGLAESEKSLANLRRSAPPPSRGRRDDWPIHPLPMEGGCPKGRGLAEGEKSLANLRRYAPPPSRGRREKWDE